MVGVRRLHGKIESIHSDDAGDDVTMLSRASVRMETESVITQAMNFISIRAAPTPAMNFWKR
ncbi:hypothetical protein AUQ37_02520 [Candidatus Methanomethylophilus sp. 1R26]|nr:hypothetical protein AUQ37_02520 [Candidatus Methanomethylophilus sp. 1R26]